MNKDNAKDYLPLVQALADGREIQIWLGGEWGDINDILFSEPVTKYRIKPEPKTFWANAYIDRTDRYSLGGLCESEDSALSVRDMQKQNGYTYLRTVKIEL